MKFASALFTSHAMKSVPYISLTFCFLFLSNLHAQLSMPAIFGDNMPLQADRDIPFWGEAAPNAEVTVSFINAKGKVEESETVTSGTDGSWMLELDDLDDGDTGVVKVESSTGDILEFSNVIVGDVWIASGQSNMQWQLRRTDNPEEAIAAADFPEIRLFMVSRIPSLTPIEEVNTDGGWVVCSPETISEYSGVAYYFARYLNEKLDRPIGLICTYWGGTRAEAWTPEERLRTLPLLDQYYENYKDAVENKDQLLAEWEAEVAAWEAAGSEGRRPRRPGDFEDRHAPSALYNSMLHPLIPYAIKGAIWYQGESNAGRHVSYRTLFPAMIDSWRDLWGQGDFPFLYVELANFLEPQVDPVQAPNAWGWIRHAQQHALQMPKTAVATAIDVGMADDIHPTDKETVGERLAMAALNVAYGKRGYHSAKFSSAKKYGNRFIIRVKNAYQGLEVRDDSKRLPFAVKDSEGNYHWAEAKIAGRDIEVHSPDVEDPVAVYYAWANNPVIEVYNSQGLPLLPFRTDFDAEWEAVKELYD